ncbi:MAG TPA: hypothetical protein VE379_08310 [Vicinamibacterales bacterium]|nr:hypothetical protein [Vicinamibacterales bacterium]
MFRTRRSTGSLTGRDLQPILSDLRKTNSAAGAAWPGDRTDRQPVHTVYGGAHLFRANTAQKLGALALSALDEHAPDASTFAEALGFASGDPALAAVIRARVADKLQREPIEDYRLDFEDGYGIRPDDEEDGHAQAAAAEIAAGGRAGTLPPFIGIRLKPLSRELHGRSLRTLDVFVTALARESRKELPDGFVVTLPKIVVAGQVAAVARTCAALERRLGLRSGVLKIELMIETPQAIVGATGSVPLRELVAAGDGRVSAAHFGAYDYTALCGISSSWQQLGHQSCDFARNIMQVALAQSGVRLSDGATTVMPAVPHRVAPDRPLSEEQRRQNRESVFRAWRLHYHDVRRSLINGFYQGWDLHPTQLPTRYAAVYEFFLSARAEATARLKHLTDRAVRATLAGEMFDDAATGQGLLNFFVRGLSSGALRTEEARETGLTVEELQGRSFLQILENRRRER